MRPPALGEWRPCSTLRCAGPTGTGPPHEVLCRHQPSCERLRVCGTLHDPRIRRLVPSLAAGQFSDAVGQHQHLPAQPRNCSLHLRGYWYGHAHVHRNSPLAQAALQGDTDVDAGWSLGFRSSLRNVRVCLLHSRHPNDCAAELAKWKLGQRSGSIVIQHCAAADVPSPHVPRDILGRGMLIQAQRQNAPRYKAFEKPLPSVRGAHDILPRGILCTRARQFCGLGGCIMLFTPFNHLPLHHSLQAHWRSAHLECDPARGWCWPSDRLHPNGSCILGHRCTAAAIWVSIFEHSVTQLAF
mmetsp:Transcript_35439/g.110511  ORF Transcript_35439/g.110511 Transcript_35439/m.110511 type:complete len:298 (+) Transcript_35439:914-1807(+)